jgi:enoyl reductase
MSRAVVFPSYGPPDVLELIDVGRLRPGLGEVLVDVRAAGVQPFDCKWRRGDLDGFVPAHFPQRLGNELSGVVTAVGDDVDNYRPGDEVIAFTSPGAYAEAVAVPVSQVIPKPPDLGWEEAGVLSASGQTAWNALRAVGVGEGDVVLIHAAAGGVGTMATQLATLWGATVIGTASERNHDYLRSLGAIPVTYGGALAERVQAVAPHRRVTAALDFVGGGAPIEVSTQLIDDRTRIATIADPQGAARAGVLYPPSQRSTAVLTELAALAAAGELRIEIAATVPLDDAAEAHRLVESGHVRGKVALTAL